MLVEVPVHENVTVVLRDEGLFDKHASPDMSVISPTTFMYTNSHTGQEDISHIIQIDTFPLSYGYRLPNLEDGHTSRINSSLSSGWKNEWNMKVILHLQAIWNVLKQLAQNFYIGLSDGCWLLV